MTTVVEDLSQVPGAMQEAKRRELADGALLTFEFAPAGWLTKKGEPRKTDWRAYYWTSPDGERERMPSVTTLLDAIIPKGALVPWAEARGIEGAVEAVKQGLISDDASVGDAVRAVRGARLGADAARDKGAIRGLDVHAVIERYMVSGDAPNLGEHPVEHRGYVQAVARFLLSRDIEPVAVEELVCDPDHGYAGRVDLIGTTAGRLIVWDAKTQERGQIYDAAHVQTKLYSRAHVACGGNSPDEERVVVFAADGSFREMVCACDDRAVDAALAWARAIKPITAVCESANRAARKAAA